MKIKYSPAEQQYLKRIGSKIRTIRKEKKLSQEALALKAKIDRTYIGGVERGERNLSILNLKKISSALETTIPKIFDEEREDDEGTKRVAP